VLHAPGQIAALQENVLMGSALDLEVAWAVTRQRSAMIAGPLPTLQRYLNDVTLLPNAVRAEMGLTR